VNRRADVSGAGPSTAAAITNDQATSRRSPASADKSTDAPPARGLADLVGRRDDPGEILRRRFLVQDTEHPLAAGGQSW
jgi:hypothetical protein